MSTVGKILVILNLLCALATGGFLAFDFVVRTNWKHHAEECERELEVARANSAAMKHTFDELDKQAKNALRDLDAEKQKSKNDEIVRKVQMGDALRVADDSSSKAREADAAAHKAYVEAAQLRERVAELTRLVEDRTRIIAQKEKENRELHLATVAAAEKADVTIRRSQELLDQLTEARHKLAEMESGSGSFTLVPSTDPNRPNPPPVPVHGIIQKIDPKDGLIEISIGSDHGLRRYNTLEVYRLRPEAEYLGRLRIVDVFEKRAIGRLVQRPLALSHPVQQGDQVASSLDQP